MDISEEACSKLSEAQICFTDQHRHQLKSETFCPDGEHVTIGKSLTQMNNGDKQQINLKLITYSYKQKQLNVQY